MATLPDSVPPLIGRSEALAALGRLLEAERAVTVVGPAGVGKSSLARALLERGAGGPAVFCPLNEATGLDGVLAAVAGALGARFVDARESEEVQVRVRTALQARAPLVLVLDNAEHVADEVAQVTSLALSVPGVRCLLTSREPLFVAEEALFELPQLAPDDAVALLVARGQAVVPGLFLRGEELVIARRVVERLDRLPLAIELFASRLDVLGLEQLEARLDAPLAVLRRPAGPERHRDVEAALRCSWDLLAEGERETLLALGTCQGGAELELVEAIQAVLSPPRDLLDDVAALQRKHLVVAARQDGGRVRYQLLETVRAFVRQELVRLGEEDRFTLAHAQALLGPERRHAERTAAGYLALARELDNLFAVHRRCRVLAPRLSAQAALLLHEHLLLHGPMNVHLDVLDAGLAAAEGEPGLERRLFTARGDLRRKVGRLSAASLDLDAAAARSATALERSAVTSSAAMLCMVEGAFAQAAAKIDEAVRFAEEAEDARALGHALQRAGAIYLFNGDYPRVEEACLRAVAVLTGGLDHRATTNALTYLGIARLDQGDAARAEAAFQEARALYAEVDDRWSVAVCDGYLAVITLDRDGAEAARPLLAEAWASAQAAGHARLEAFLDAMHGVAWQLLGHLDEAETCLRRAAGLGLSLRDVLASSLGAAHLAAVLAARGGPLDEAHHWLETAQRGVLLMPNPSGRAGLAALEGVLALAEGDRAGAEALRARAAQERSGVHHRLALRVLDHALASRGTSVRPSSDLRVQRDGRRCRLPTGDVVDLTRRGPLRLILAALAAAHQEGRALDVNRLLEIGWPGQRVDTESGTARVYTAIRTLRRLGLEELLVTRDDGYALAPALELVVVDELEG